MPLVVNVRVQAGASASVRGVRVPRARIFAGHRGGDRTASIIRGVVVDGQRVEVGDDPEVQVIFRDVEGHVLDLIQGGQAGQRVRIEVVTSPTDPETTERRAVLERPVRLPPQLESRLRRLRERLPDLPDLRDLRELQLTEERLH